MYRFCLILYEIHREIKTYSALFVDLHVFHVFVSYNTNTRKIQKVTKKKK